mmetsp:Transcript_24952/g.59508  ORF Transcript_24952/g.59508 Transcript_24952/m.59508 type:complete len:210 (-) Transcript_24952:290-919(-)
MLVLRRVLLSDAPAALNTGFAAISAFSATTAFAALPAAAGFAATTGFSAATGFAAAAGFVATAGFSAAGADAFTAPGFSAVALPAGFSAAAPAPPLKISSAMFFATVPSISPLWLFIRKPITLPIWEASVAPDCLIASSTHLRVVASSARDGRNSSMMTSSARSSAASSSRPASTNAVTLSNRCLASLRRTVTLSSLASVSNPFSLAIT